LPEFIFDVQGSHAYVLAVNFATNDYGAYSIPTSGGAPVLLGTMANFDDVNGLLIMRAEAGHLYSVFNNNYIKRIPLAGGGSESVYSPLPLAWAAAAVPDFAVDHDHVYWFVNDTFEPRIGRVPVEGGAVYKYPDPGPCTGGGLDSDGDYGWSALSIDWGSIYQGCWDPNAPAESGLYRMAK
jgi:hypothetical protein